MPRHQTASAAPLSSLVLHPLAHALAAAILLAATAPAFATPAPEAEAAESTDERTLATIQVVGSREEKTTAEGTAEVLDQSVIVSSRALTVNEALRKVPGVTVRDEEGFGLRPNIGIRGSNPTRSTKVLLLEDGLPAMYAPYGDNASYYHAPIQRYDRIEVLKGAGLLRFGPQTIHGAINYITPTPPDAFSGHVQVSAGARGFGAVHASVGGNGLLVDFGYKRGEGARDNTDLEQGDLFAKYQAQLNDQHALAVRANVLREQSQVGYTGITDAEYRNFGADYYPFEHDLFDIRHTAFSLSHDWTPNETLKLHTSAYYTDFQRDWWRQASTTSDTQCGVAFRNARFIGQIVDPNACASIQGRLRNYYTWGVDSRLSFARSVFGTAGSSEVGVRWHEEKQIRYQRNGIDPTLRDGVLVENNLRSAEALSAFATTTFDLGDVRLTPSLRRERIDFGRVNRLPGGLAGRERVNSTSWGLTADWRIADTVTVYASAHEGFAPPRVEDLIAGNGAAVAVDAEKSLNLEAGLRTRWQGLDLEAVAFRNDFDNQIVVGSIAGGSTPLAQGETAYAGLEFAAGFNRGALQRREGEFYANLAITWLATAEQSTVLRRADTGAAANGSVAGNRLPYAPELTSTFRIGYVKGAWDGSIEMQHIGRQFADFANNRYPVDGSGQFGELDGYATWSATLNWEPNLAGWSAYLAIKNLSDREYIVDRTRGILLGNPRQVVTGVRYAW
ncbi:MAG: TonB-dependent receptor [Lysobacteraceae bacterium]|nr:MAG: TonB-dependent receptor [Xanthomonadaceae bacterium]